MSTLFSPLRLRDVTLRNRVVVSPMCQYSCVDGLPTDWHLVHLGSRAVGGAALVLAEATAVTPEGRISPGDAGLWNDTQTEAFARIARFVQAQGAVAGIQLAHAGRKASTQVPWLGHGKVEVTDGGWIPVAPSAVAFAADYPQPVALDAAGLDAVVAAFAQGADRALQAGMQTIELHMAHGYLLHEFLSPLSNQRQDEHGGDLAGRMRLPLRVVQAVRAVWPERLPLLVRISATDWLPGGWDLDQSVEFCRELKREGVDLVDCSTGGNVPRAHIPVGPGYQLPFAEQIRARAGIATGAVGMLTDAAQCEQIVALGHADVVLLARELLRDPYWPLHAARVLRADAPWPVQYQRAV